MAVEIELPEGRFRMAKRWINRAHAQVLDATGRLIAQADEAEAWIDRLMDGGLAGPSGLLWVRQGLMGLESDDRKDRERDQTARRDLLSSVAGEIDLMTGGRRMDAVVDRVAEALARLATATGRPKAGGEWARALEEAAELAAEESALRPRAERLTGDLARRAEVHRTLARQTDPADAAARAEALVQAQAAHQAGLGVNAGHDLSLHNLAHFVAHVPGIAEVSIGHALISDALEMGYSAAVVAYLDALGAGAERVSP